jgi:hypothetical protein
MLALITKLFDASKVGGAARAGVAMLLGYLAAKFGGAVAQFLTPEIVEGIAGIAAAAAVTVWSSLAKDKAVVTVAPQADEPAAS